MKYLLWIFVCSVLLASCEQAGESTDPTPTTVPEGVVDDRTDTEEIVDPAPVPNAYLVSENGFYGVRPGATIGDLPIKVEKGTLSNGEGDFEVYYIIDDLDQQRLGYFYPDPNDAQKVGIVTITTPKAKTTEGFGPTTTHADIQEKRSDYTIHGSEIESRTHIYYDNIALRMDHPSMNYEMDKVDLPTTSKVVHIELRP